MNPTLRLAAVAAVVSTLVMTPPVLAYQDVGSPDLEVIEGVYLPVA